MKMIQVMTVTDTEFVTSNVAENDYGVWSAATTYALNDYVIVTGTTHKVYHSAQAANLNNDPTTDDGTWWTEVSATNRWKAFDLKLADQVSNSGSITYTIQPSSMITGLAFFNLNAGTVRVQIDDDSSPAVSVYDTTVDLIDTTSVVDWFTFYFSGVEYDSEALFIGVPGYTWFSVNITISASSGNALVGQIVLGEVFTLGETIDGTTVGIQDYSVKDRDAFGNAIITQRAFSDQTTFEFSMNTDDARRVKRILSANRATPAVYFVGVDAVRFGATVYGFFQDFSIPLTVGNTSFASLEIEGLV